MSKRLFNRALCVAVLLILTVLFISASLCTIKAQATEISPVINTWSALQNAIGNTKSGDTIVLNSDVTAAESDIALSVPDGTVLSLDLNGHTINRNLTSPKGSDGAVIIVQSGAALTIKDSSKGAAGKITGGYASHGGGVRNNGTLIVEGGCITGNTAKDAGGGIVNYGVLVFEGGTVTANTSHDEGGGIYNAAHGYLTVAKDAVYGNNAPTGADILNVGSMKNIGGDTFDSVALNSAFTMLSVLPALALLIVLFSSVRLDNYLDKRQKRVMYIITVLVLALVIQNHLDTWLYHQGSLTMLRTINSIYGYAVRPAILAMFLHISARTDATGSCGRWSV